ncbi:MAG: hypothetical protein UR80_C0016G0006 [Parcubacteria group bacterium GW2011_GWB1_35_5]|nr:MAG: hypothetical protein UR50_C0004G0045 [Parcubacteria group bacterium GW2011_GWC1_34_10]KKP80867.1 MAG: hypothetical protein UR80_C0016G0006 [Parcubacteria group bacterium GW2011_GWB1_35_5]OHA87444.1 MAG: hypothetical protein A2726_00850 [Candidatus Zambryskibacteria bacterium RIFCSPHIGHO2_01_FULL_35_32]
MKNNILLFIFVLVISLATASYFGGWYDYFVPQYDYSLLGIDQETVVYIAGLFFAYVFFVPFIFELLGKGNKNKWIVVLLVPVVLFYLYDNVMLTYIPILASITGCLLAKLINLTIKKFKHQNPPMIINK